MCGLIVFQKKEKKLQAKEWALIKKSLDSLKHRGPDESSIKELGNCIFAHTRLSIVGLEHGLQPMLSESLIWVHNGEIYNHQKLRKHFPSIKEDSDSAVIGYGYKKWGVGVFDRLDGVFATVLYDGTKDEIIAARDPLGVKPLYYGYTLEGDIVFASEMKALAFLCERVETFPPGHYYSSTDGFVCYYLPQYKVREDFVTDYEKATTQIKESLVKSVQKRLMADVPVGALLSGGLDSSLVAAIAAKELKKLDKPLHTFSVGLDPKSDDLKFAKMVSEHIGSIHHEIIFTEKEGIDTLKEMIYHLETFDITTVRASTPMFMMAKKIKELGIKVVLSGEGADEIFGGYLYFRSAPNSTDFHKECLRRIDLLYSADLLRADRATMGAGVEARVPFLDKEFLEVSMGIHADLKVVSSERPEKWILRKAFAKDNLIPDEILWRQKEQFSDGVGYSWVDRLKDQAAHYYCEADLQTREYDYLPPQTLEALMYRDIFAGLFKLPSIAYQSKAWVPKWQKNLDPSGRANTDHIQSTEVKFEIPA